MDQRGEDLEDRLLACAAESKRDFIHKLVLR